MKNTLKTIASIPYMGSKRRLAKPIMDFIIKNNPNVKYFYDLFGGGGSLSFEALSRKEINQVYYNEIDTGVVRLLEKIRDEGVTNEFYNWISKEEFNRCKYNNNWYGGLLKTCWSFGTNVQKGYLFSKDIENYKKVYHEVVVNITEEHTNNLKWLSSYCKEYILTKYGVDEELVLSLIGSEVINDRRLSIRNQITAFKKKCEKKNIHLKQLQQLEQLEQLERLERLKELEMLDNLLISNLSYQQVNIDTPLEETIIYCDPPYFNTGKYQNSINHNEFLDWCKSNKYKVYVSSYELDLPCVLEIDHRSSLSATNNNKKVIEKLYCNK